MSKTLAVILALVVTASSASDWKAVMRTPCPRCVSADWELNMEPLPIPEHAVICSFVGEFASRATWSMIDLDNGQVVERDWVRQGDQPPLKHLGPVSPRTLDALRTSAASLWRSQPLHTLYFPPGSVEQDYVVSGARLVSFSRFAPEDRAFLVSVSAAIKDAGADCNASGSFVVMPSAPPKK